MFRWSAIMLGPLGTPFEGGVWKLDMSFPPAFPERPPMVRFRNEIFHPNVFKDGSIYLSLLRGSGWSPSYDVSTILLAIQALLSDPETRSDLKAIANPDAEALYLRDRRGYDAKIVALVVAQNREDAQEMGALSAVP